MADLADCSDTQGTVIAMEISNSQDVTQPEDHHGEEPAAVDAHA